MFPDYFFRVAMKKIILWFGVVAVSLLVMVQPAKALGTITGPYTWTTSAPVQCPSSQSMSASQSCLMGVMLQSYPSRLYGAGAYEIAPLNRLPINRLDPITYATMVYGAQFVYRGDMVCPTNSTGPASGPTGDPLCSCIDGFVPNAGATACEAGGGGAIPVVCPVAGTVFSSGVYDLGTMPKMPANKACDLGCLVIFGGDVDSTAIVDGVKHYYATGDYVYNGFSFAQPAVATCPVESIASTSISSVPNSTCAAGQNYGTVNGIMTCLKSDGTVADVNSASAVDAAQTITDKQFADMLAAVASAVAAAGGSASDVLAAQVTAAADAAAGGTPDPVQAAFCVENPTSSICVEQDFGTVEDSNFTEKSINVAITPVSVGGAGSCPAPSSMILHGQQYWFEWTTYCNYATGIKPILLAFAWLSAAGLLIGGFKTA